MPLGCVSFANVNNATQLRTLMDIQWVCLLGSRVNIERWLAESTLYPSNYVAEWCSLDKQTLTSRLYLFFLNNIYSDTQCHVLSLENNINFLMSVLMMRKGEFIWKVTLKRKIWMKRYLSLVKENIQCRHQCSACLV